MKTNRTGKIARLPLVMREALNRRIEDGWSGRRLVRWLNELPEVREVLAGEFGGRAIAEQNLSAWKQVGIGSGCRNGRRWNWRGGWGEDLEAVERGKMQEAGGEIPDGEAMSEVKGGKRTMLETLAFWTVMQFGATARQQLRTVEGKEKWKMMRQLVADVCKLRGAEQAGRRVDLEERRMRIEKMRYGAVEGWSNADGNGVLFEGLAGSGGRSTISLKAGMGTADGADRADREVHAPCSEVTPKVGNLSSVSISVGLAVTVPVFGFDRLAKGRRKRRRMEGMGLMLRRRAGKWLGWRGIKVNQGRSREKNCGGGQGTEADGGEECGDQGRSRWIEADQGRCRGGFNSKARRREEGSR